MKYFQVEFNISCPKELLQCVCDVVSAEASVAGFDAFEERPDGMVGYALRDKFDECALRTILSELPFDGVEISYKVSEAPDEDWNAAWEEEGFDPIAVGSNLVVHDGRHLPPTLPASVLQVEIDARLAFGTGNHSTTQIMAGALMEMDLKGKTVLDCGTGTGILSIVALLRGAAAAVGYDIDEWSVENARHNAVINRVDKQFTVVQGDSSVIETLGKKFDVVVANINRNVLLADMERMAGAMKPGATLAISGFMEGDCEMLEAKADSLGLKNISKQVCDEWAGLQMISSTTN